MLIGVHVLFAIHLAHWLRNGTTLSPLEPSEAMEAVKHGVLNAGFFFFVIAILSTALFGRFFCGWGCHLLALQDACGAVLRRLGVRPVPLRSRLLAWVPLAAFLYMFVWPLVARFVGGAGLPEAKLELTTSGFWDTFPDWPVALATFLVCGFVIVVLLGNKAFCTYACPYGGIFALAERWSPLRIRVSDACEGCGHCTATCTSNVRVHEEVREHGMVVDPGCMKCMDCVSVCPKDALSLAWGRPAVGRPSSFLAPERRLPWRDDAILAGFFVAAFLVFRGLYEKVPFLFALGLSAVLAFVQWTFVRSIRGENLRLRTLRLRKGGAWTPAGLAFVFSVAVVFLVQGHSAVIQWHQTHGMRAFREVQSLRAGLLDGSVDPPGLEPQEREGLARAVRHLSQVADRGLLETRGLPFQLTWMNLLLGRDRAAEAYLEQATENGNAPPSSLETFAARLALARGDVPAAAAALERAVRADSGVLHPALALATLRARSGDTAGAVLVLEDAARRFPNSVEVRYNLGLAHGLAGDPASARRAWADALRLDPDFVPAREALRRVGAGLSEGGA